MESKSPLQVWLSKCQKDPEIKAMNAQVGEGCKTMVESIDGGGLLDMRQAEAEAVAVEVRWAIEGSKGTLEGRG